MKITITLLAALVIGAGSLFWIGYDKINSLESEISNLESQIKDTEYQFEQLAGISPR